MTKEKLIKILQWLPAWTRVEVASDEERNALYHTIEVNINSENNRAVIFWLSWSEELPY